MAFPTTNILDTFNRPDEGPPPGSQWTLPTYGTFTGLKVQSNQCAINVAGATSDGMAYWNPNTFGPDCEVFCTVSSISGSDAFLILHARFDIVNGNGYKVDWDDPTNRVRVFYVTTGSRTQIGANITQAMTQGDSLGLEVSGTALTVYFKSSASATWTSIGSRTDASYSSAGHIMLGCWNVASGGRYDNFGGGTISTAGATGIFTPKSGFWGDL